MNVSAGDRSSIAERVRTFRQAIDRTVRWLDRHTLITRRIPIRARVALFGAGVVAVTVVIFSLAVYYLVDRNLIQQQEATLTQRGDVLGNAIERSGRLPRINPLYQAEDCSSSPDLFYQLLTSTEAPAGSTCVINGIDPEWPSSTFAGVPTDRGVIRVVQPQNGPEVRAYIRAWIRPDLGVGGYLIVGQPTFVVDNQLAGLRLFLFLGALLSLITAGSASWLVAGRALRPLDEMASTAEAIGRTQDLSRRLPTTAPNDEVGRLQRSFNQMLGQLEDAYTRLRSALNAQRRFVADASHELRTPLTTIRGNVGLLLKRDDITTEDRAAALHDIAGESERMSRMVQDLLTLARADAGYHLEKAPLDLRPIVQDVSRQAQTLQPTRRIELLDGRAATVRANADAIKQLLWILIDNAFKHTRDDGRIQVELQPGPRWASLVVRDDGTGVAAQDLDRIFERFYQSDASRTGEGTGLGLAIARWIAQEHGGRIYAGNNPQGGARFTVELPVAPKS
jgi:two-component system, OmpR family, sensor kinase